MEETSKDKHLSRCLGQLNQCLWPCLERPLLKLFPLQCVPSNLELMGRAKQKRNWSDEKCDYGIRGFWKMHWRGKYVAWWMGLNRKITPPPPYLLPLRLEGGSLRYKAKSFLYEHWMSNSFTPRSLWYWNFIQNCLINNSSIILCCLAHAFSIRFNRLGNLYCLTTDVDWSWAAVFSKFRYVLLQRRNLSWYLWLEKTVWFIQQCWTNTISASKLSI